MAQQNKLPNIQVSAVGGKRNYFSLTHDVYATHRVGKIVPYMCRFFDAGSKMKADVETLEYNAPMVAPTVGDVKFKQWHYFVGLDKLIPNFSEALARNPDLLGNLEMYIKQFVPHISLNRLSMLALIGSHCTIYYTMTSDPWIGAIGAEGGLTSTSRDDNAFLIEVGDTDGGNVDNIKSMESLVGAFFQPDHNSNTSGNLIRDYSNTDDWEDYKYTPLIYSTMPYTDLNGIGINTDFLNLSIDLSPEALGGRRTDQSVIPLANPNLESFFDWTYEGEKVYANPQYTYLTHGLDCSPVPFDKPDAKISRTLKRNVELNGVETEVVFTLHFCFRLSDFGRAIRDVLNSSGYQLNFSSEKQVTLLPLLAEHMAYYHCQSLQMWENYKMTSAYKLLRMYDYENQHNIDDLFKGNIPEDHTHPRERQAFEHFIGDELGQMWAICPQDFISAHMRDPVTAPLVYNNLDRFTSASSADVTVTGEPINNDEPDRDDPNQTLNNHTPFINKITHDVYVAELLKRLTLRMNVNTLEGRKTKQFCELNGWGDWIDQQQVDFIDYGELRIQMKPVVSQSDTSNSEGAGADLGQYGGRGFGSGSQRGKTYVNRVPGYYVILTTIYVDAGYCQSIDPYNFQIEVDDFYRRDFDSLGYEINDKNLVCGCAPYVKEGESGETDKPFGYAPRDMKYKQINNTLLGAFCVGTQSDIYDKYHMERLMPFGQQPVVDVGYIEDAHTTHFSLGSRFNLADVPMCGNIWRYLGMFPWIGQYDRIFKIQPAEAKRMRGLWSLDEYGDNLPEVLRTFYAFFTLSPENYTLLNTLYFDSWQDKVPISRSFGTLEDIFEGGSSTSVKKE